MDLIQNEKVTSVRCDFVGGIGDLNVIRRPCKHQTH
jgi:hypothetical protein